MRVLVCGSRDWDDEEAVSRRLLELHPDTYVMHGNAPGADRIASRAAADMGMPQRAFPADWERHGKRAGILRNLDMLSAHPDLVIAFWDGKSRGTRHTIAEARKRGIPVEVIRA